ncbi:TetR/AcrR family transcriptional regulator [Solimonas terrae]|uniref:TetR/AcrR family transcriptional regulator n=1 Tax=Solimonas terrae TaxID=1396819 RepID=A0A6M2BUX3_9GAMM|nr:TetR/AcrR family transcriptional regulator [Solimonas terrae]
MPTTSAKPKKGGGHRPTSAATKSARHAAPGSAAEIDSEIEAGKETRGARRKRETRQRLVEAAFRLMAERGLDAVAINEITEAADVGFGTFYNHFESRDQIYAVLMDTVFENFGDALDQMLNDVKDPAEVISIAIRHTLMRARREPLWGKFLMREGLSSRILSRGLGVRLMRDIQAGVASGRFNVPDPIMSFIAIAGGVLATISAELQLDSDANSSLNQYGLSKQDIPERAATVFLHSLGLTFAQARNVAQRPLPIIERGRTI